MRKAVFHASHWGAYQLEVEGGRILRALPDPRDPEPSEILPSVTSWMDPALRIHQPMVRQGWLEGSGKRGHDRFVPVTWDEVLPMVARELTRVRADFGPEAVFAGSYGWAGSGRLHHPASLLKRLLNLTGGFTDHVDTYSIAAGPVILRHILGSDEAAYGQSSTLDTVAEQTQTLLVFGALSPRTAQCEAGGLAEHSLSLHLRRLKERGVRVILISPQRSDLPDWMPCEWWPIRANSDTALMLGLAGEVVQAGAHDATFLARYTSGSEAFLAYLRGQTDGQIKDADWAAHLTGLSGDQIRALAAHLPTTRSMLTVSWSLQRAQYGEQPFWAAVGLAAILGQIGLEGGGVGFGYGSTGGAGAPIGLAKSPAIPKGTNPTGSYIPVARIADMLLNPQGPYDYEGARRQYPDIKLLYWAGGNPFHHHQDLNRLEEAWARPQTVIVQDPVWTATALRADIVLPATTSLERNDIAANGRTRRFMAMQQAVKPLGQARSDFAIFAGLAHEMGVGAAFDEGRDEMGWLRALYDKSRDHAREALGFEMVSFDQFWADGSAEVPVKRHYTYLGAFRTDPEGHALRTESGKIVLGSDLLAARAYGDCGAVPQWIAPQLHSPKGDLLHLLSNQPQGRLHSQLLRGAASQPLLVEGREVARLSPHEAAKRGLKAGDLCRIESPRGQTLAHLRIDPHVADGHLVLPTGAWFAPDPQGLDLSGNPNVLTEDIPSSAFGQGCAAYSCQVTIQRHEAPARNAQSHYDAYKHQLIPPIE